MALLSPGDQQRLREEFATMSRPVRLLFFTQSLGCETCPETRRILDELPALSDKITIEEINLVLEGDKAGRYGIDRVPAVALVTPEDSAEPRDSRIRFLGAPAGYEFIALIRAVLLVGGAREPDLSEQSRARLARLQQPVAMHVFTTPT
jgi:alkyl hydroperoxide reductase subunit AhpF